MKNDGGYNTKKWSDMQAKYGYKEVDGIPNLAEKEKILKGKDCTILGAK